MPSTKTLQNVVDIASIFTRQIPLTNVGGISNQPAFGMGDWVRGFILGPPFAWRWNRSQTAFITTAGVQDYALTNWQASTAVALGLIYIDPNGYQQQVTTAGNTGNSAPAWSATPGNTTADNAGGGTAVWTNKGAVGLATPLATFGWLEKASVNDGSKVFELEVLLNLAEESVQNLPNRISARLDNDAGVVTFRLVPIPNTTYNVKISYQNSAPTFASLSDTWAPIPDYFWYLYSQGFLAKTYEYIDNERFGPALQLFVRQVVAASEGLSDSQKNIFLDDRINTARQGSSQMGGSQSGQAGRSLR